MRQHEIVNVDDLWKILLEETEKINKDIVKNFLNLYQIELIHLKTQILI